MTISSASGHIDFERALDYICLGLNSRAGQSNRRIFMGKTPQGAHYGTLDRLSGTVFVERPTRRPLIPDLLAAQVLSLNLPVWAADDHPIESVLPRCRRTSQRTPTFEHSPATLLQRCETVLSSGLYVLDDPVSATINNHESVLGTMHGRDDVIIVLTGSTALYESFVDRVDEPAYRYRPGADRYELYDAHSGTITPVRVPFRDA